jgi:hypothetical protein
MIDFPVDCLQSTCTGNHLSKRSRLQGTALLGMRGVVAIGKPRYQAAHVS